MLHVRPGGGAVDRAAKVTRPLLDAADRWLPHLRRDRRGLPIPYINLWGPQTVDNTRVAYDQHIGRDAVFVDDVGDVPDFTKQCPQRQRECMVDGLCQVCHRSVPWSRRYLVVASMSVEFVSIKGTWPQGPRPVIFEPWLDQRCLDIALGLCPALIRRQREGQLTVHPVRSPRDVNLALSTGWIEGPLEQATKGAGVGMWVKAELRTLDIRTQPSL
jgi:hypothetical protein